jgi:hypothetical protein
MKVMWKEDEAWAKHETEQLSQRIHQRCAPVAAPMRNSGEPVRPKFWTAQDLADYLCISVSWVKTKARQNVIPHIRSVAIIALTHNRLNSERGSTR